MKKLIILICLLFGCSAETLVFSSEETIENDNAEESFFPCIQKQGDCKYFTSCEKGMVTWEPDLSDAPNCTNLCTYYKCKCTKDDCEPLLQNRPDMTTCGINLFCHEGLCH